MKNMKVALVFGFLILTLFGAYYYQDIISGSYSDKINGSNDLTNNKKKVQNLIERKYHVKGMYCSSCKAKIEKKVLQVPGVTSVDVNEDSNEMIVKYISGNDNVKQTMDVVKALGYTIGLKSKSGKLQVTDFNVTFK